MGFSKKLTHPSVVSPSRPEFQEKRSEPRTQYPINSAASIVCGQCVWPSSKRTMESESTLFCHISIFRSYCYETDHLRLSLFSFLPIFYQSEQKNYLFNFFSSEYQLSSMQLWVHTYFKSFIF